MEAPCLAESICWFESYSNRDCHEKKNKGPSCPAKVSRFAWYKRRGSCCTWNAFALYQWPNITFRQLMRELETNRTIWPSRSLSEHRMRNGNRLIFRTSNATPDIHEAKRQAEKAGTCRTTVFVRTSFMQLISARGTKRLTQPTELPHIRPGGYEKRHSTAYAAYIASKVSPSLKLSHYTDLASLQ